MRAIFCRIGVGGNNEKCKLFRNLIPYKIDGYISPKETSKSDPLLIQ